MSDAQAVVRAACSFDPRPALALLDSGDETSRHDLDGVRRRRRRACRRAARRLARRVTRAHRALRLGADPVARRGADRTALTAADRALGAFLSGAHVDGKSDGGGVPIAQAAWRGYPALVVDELLRESGA
jgi:hypothetical protein